MKTLYAVGCLAAAAALAACGGGSAATSSSAPSPSATATDLSGTLTLTGFGNVLNIDDSSCQGLGGYSDIKQGAQVLVTDASQATVAIGSVNAGTLTKTDSSITCTFSFLVSSVPLASNFYSVKIANREGPQFSRDDIMRPIQLTLGDD